MKSYLHEFYNGDGYVLNTEFMDWKDRGSIGEEPKKKEEKEFFSEEEFKV